MLKNIFSCMFLAFAFSTYAEDALSSDTATVNVRKYGKKEGVWENHYFLSHKLKSTCEFENGKRSGTRYTYYKSGFLKKYTQYENNKKDGLECFYIDKVRHESQKRCVRYENGKIKERIQHPGIEMFE